MSSRDATLSRSALTWAGDLRRASVARLWLIPLTIAAAYAVRLLAKLPHTITHLAWNSDAASGFTVTEALAKTGSEGHTVIASTGQWVSLWFGLLTAGLPFHRALWGVAPTLLFTVTALIVGWSVAQVADRRAAILAVLIALIASAPALVFFMAPVAHNTVYPCTALLGAYVVWLTREHRRRRLMTLATPALVGVVIGACLASDFLLCATALVPLALTAILAGVRGDRRSRLVSLSALATIAVAIPIAKLTSTIMGSLGYVTLALPIKLASLGELPERAQVLFRGLKALFNGYLGTEAPGTLHTELGFASDVVMSAAFVAVLVIGARTTIKFFLRGARNTQTAAERARSLHVIYWVTSGACACGAFWIAGQGPTVTHESYYGTVVFSVAAVTPLLLFAGPRARWLVAAGASIFFTASLVGLSSPLLDSEGRLEQNAARIVKLAQAHQATTGYAGYWDASSLTWNTDERVAVRPLMECPNPEGANICPFYMEDVKAWYTPQERRTFLLVDSDEAWVSALPQGLGRPLAIYALGAIHMLIYPYDIASRLGPQP